jgi:hypothetical protein
MEKLSGAGASSMPSTEQLKRRKLILERSKILFSAYRADQYANEEGFMASVAMVLGQYSDDVIVFITDPRTGVQRHSKWPPTIAEIIEACDKRMQHIAKLGPRKKAEPLALGPPNEERPTLDELKAKYGDNWGLTPPEPRKPPEKAPSWESIATYYQANPERIRQLTRLDEVSSNE